MIKKSLNHLKQLSIQTQAIIIFIFLLIFPSIGVIIVYQHVQELTASKANDIQKGASKAINKMNEEKLKAKELYELMYDINEVNESIKEKAYSIKQALVIISIALIFIPIIFFLLFYKYFKPAYQLKVQKSVESEDIMLKEAVVNDDGDNQILEDPDEENKKKKYEKSGLKKEQADKYLKKLEEFMHNEKPYCNGDLTITDISNKLKIPKHYITQIINEKLNKKFYTYVNEYRVNEVKKRIGNKKYKNHSLLRIAFDSGFNSKSTFNTVFKKITKMTPSEYRKLQTSDD